MRSRHFLEPRSQVAAPEVGQRQMRGCPPQDCMERSTGVDLTLGFLGRKVDALYAGTVCILGRVDLPDNAGQAAVERVVAAYQAATRHRPQVFTGSSSGSAAFGCLRIKRRQ